VFLGFGETIWRDKTVFILLLEQAEGKRFIRAVWPGAVGAIQGAIQLGLGHATDKIIGQPAAGVQALHLVDAQTAVGNDAFVT
jgi:hypothetical protein